MINKLCGELKKYHNLAEYTSWHIGGNARYFYKPYDLSDLSFFLKNFSSICGEKKIIFLGAGSNVLIADSGVDAIVICLRGVINTLTKIDDMVINAECGVTCAQLVAYSLGQGLTDCIFLAGIPGTIGGALAMNAGAYGDCLWNHVVSVKTINNKGEIKIRKAHEFKADYRSVSGLASNEWFVGADFRFALGDIVAAKEKMRELLQKRKASQPLDEYNCGSVFKNPPNDFAARLIESMGLKGKRVGGAKVSEKHANFIINTGSATAKDVEQLMQEIILAVAREYKIVLVPEVKFLH